MSKSCNSKLNLLFALAMTVALAAFTAGCGDESSSSSCSNDNDCSTRGTVCDAGSGKCTTISCTSDADCTGGLNRKCYQNSCTVGECTSDGDCTSDPRFGAGFSCQSQICVQAGACTTREDCSALNQVCNLVSNQCQNPPAVCSSDADCVAPTTCDTASGTCGSASCTMDAECAAGLYCDGAACVAGCRAGGCDVEGEVCNTTTRMCEMGGECTPGECNAMGMACDPDTGLCVERTGKGICEACERGNHDECGGPGDRCASFNNATFCAFNCEVNGDCPSGFECLPVSSAANGCIPLSRTCEGCLVSGCPADQVCNPADGMCAAGTPLCEECASDLECGSGAACVPFQGRTRCMAACGADGSCAAGTTCNTSGNICEPDSGVCVECMLDPTSCTNAGTVLDVDACACVECSGDMDCTNGGELCAEGVGECVPGTGKCMTTADCGGTGVCYGALAGQRQGACVECVQNADCGGANCVGNLCEATCNPPCGAGQTCNPLTGMCSAGGSCTSDPDCENQRGAGWLCDPMTSLCYEPGSCNPGDPTIAPCYAPTSCMTSMLTMGMTCTGCNFAGMDCRPGESCLDIFPIPGFSLGCMAGGGIGFP